MKTRRIVYTIISASVLIAGGYLLFTRANLNRSRSIGEVVDEFNHVKVYFNGGIESSVGRNLTADGYNLGIKYQCVEFVKRYYFERFGHKMPDSFGNAKDYFDQKISDGEMNPKRGLLQFKNGSSSSPQVDDILVLGATIFNRYGHVAIVASVSDTVVTVVQQNPGPFSKSRENIKLLRSGGIWTADNHRVLGWLRLRNHPL